MWSLLHQYEDYFTNVETTSLSGQTDGRGIPSFYPSIWIPCQHDKSSQTALIALCFYRCVLHNNISDKFYINLCVTFFNFDIGSMSNCLVSTISLSGILGSFQKHYRDILPHQYLEQFWCWPFCELFDLSNYVMVSLRCECDYSLRNIWTLSKLTGMVSTSMLTFL